MNRWYLDENDIDIYLKCTDDVMWHYNKKELVRILNDLETKVAEKNNTIENWQMMYESVVHTCHNDKEEIERLNKQLETQENTITNLVEDNRASQEWYKMQLAEKDDEITQRLVIQERDYEQDKISFAVEQLTLFKNTIVNKMNNPYSVNIKHILSDIDNQIKQLKEMK